MARSSPASGGSGRVTGAPTPVLAVASAKVIRAVVGRTGAGSIAAVRERWLSKRAVSMHVGMLLFVPGCALAAWWQITRAFGGNDLSYLYSIEWPIFAIVALYFWWQLIHTDYETVGLKGLRRQAAAEAAQGGTEQTPEGSGARALIHLGSIPQPRPESDDPDLAAYNARLAQLASKGPKTWRKPESVVVRRTQ